jgi:cyclopropane fatty-acyl-phospholipid synthase-like methyltransferase
MKNAEFCTLIHSGVDYSKIGCKEYLFKSGEEVINQTLDNVLEYIKNKDRALEIGYGIGRRTFSHALIFKEVRAIDVSETMLKKLNSLAQQRGIKNIATFLPNQEWDQLSPIDYAYSFLVFQHIENIKTITNYISRTAFALKKSGIAQFQFDTRPQNFLYKLRKTILDFLLPKTYRSGIRRIRRNSKELVPLFNNYRLKVIDAFNEDTENHIFLLQKL